jgi:hypothetical protein
MIPALEPIFKAYDAGHAALLVCGRSLRDLTCDEQGKMRPLLETLRRGARERGLAMVQYSLAGGVDWDPGGGEQDRRTIEQALRTHHLLDIAQDSNEIARVLRAIASLARTPTTGLKWSDGADLRFLVLVEFAEHVVPGSMNPGTQSDSQILAIELSHITGNSLALRSSGNLVVFHTRDGLMIDDLVAQALNWVRLPQPNGDEKAGFLRAGLAVYNAANFEKGLTLESVTHLTTNTPNRGLEALLRASHRTHQAISAKMLAQQKSCDVEQLSQGTLRLLDTSRVENTVLCGQNIAVPRLLLERYGAALLRADQAMPTAVLLVGPPGCGKTDLALVAARAASAAAYQLLSPKGSFVGETERRARLQQDMLAQWIPNVGFVDEVTESFPMERSDFDGDSGASKAILGAWLSGFSDSSRAGRSLIIGTTNVPWRIGAAMDSRFVTIPILHPLATDYAAIVVATGRRVQPDLVLDLEHELVREGARIFYEKGASPRHIRSALSNALMLHGKLTPETVLFAAGDFCAFSDFASAVYCDLWAVKKCSSRSFFPWIADPANYPYPDHLRSVVDPSTGDIRRDDLDKRIQELKPYANV